MGIPRLGIETSRIPHSDRHGLLWLSRGELFVSSGTLRFVTAGCEGLDPGTYDIPYQNVSMILLGPGTSITHDVFRLTASHGTALIAVGEDGVRMYSAQPLGPDWSALARRQTNLWADGTSRIFIARAMYAKRMGEIFPNLELSVLRGMEGARAREMYFLMAHKFGISWKGRNYDRKNPEGTDIPNQALNHAATVAYAASSIAVAATRTIPQLGFIHEDSGQSFILDIADIFRDTFTLPVAFGASKQFFREQGVSIERHVRKHAGVTLRRQGIISKMIDMIKDLLEEGI
jgi:CRISPR-associated protein Cas1